MHRKRFLSILTLLILFCAVQASWPTPSAAKSNASEVIKGKNFVIVTVKSEESLASLARRYLGRIDKAWQIANYNGIEKARAGQRLVIPLKPVVPGGLENNGYQMVPVLYYSRITAKNTGKNAVMADIFTQQLKHLRDSGFKTISLDQLYAFLNFKEQLPPKAVVITFDTTERWAYDIAYPILLRHNLKAAIFIRPDRIGQTGHLTWDEVNRLAAAGFDIGTNGLSGKRLTHVDNGSDAEAHLNALEAEISTPRKIIRSKTNRPCRYYAYPRGDSDDMVVALLKRYGYRAAFTHNPGSNPFFVNNFKIKRSRIRNDKDLIKFREELTTFSATDLR